MAPTVDSNEAASKKSQAPRKLRAACDSCHHTKVRCTGGDPCQTCASLDLECVYSPSNRTGRPRGTKNKKTIERLNRERALSEASKIEAEKMGAYHALNNNVVISLDSRNHPMPIPGAALHQPYMPLPGDPMAIDMTGHVPHDLSTLSAMPMPTEAPSALEMSSMPWAHLPEQHPAGWLPEDMAVGSTQITQSPMGDMFDMTNSGMAMLQPGCHPQSFYLTPDSSRRGTQSRPSPEYQQPSGSNMQPLQQATPPNSAGDSHSVNSPPSRSVYHGSVVANVPCVCLQNQAEVLCRFEKLASEPSPRIDLLLVYAKQGIHAWKSTLQCDSCRHDNDQKSLSLCAMSIRIFVRSMQRMDLDSLHADRSDASQALAAATAAAAAGRMRGGSIDSNFTGFGGASMSRVASSQSHPAEFDADSVAATRMGIYEMTGSDQAIVTKVLLCRALAQIKEILAGLRQRLEFRQASPRRIHGGSYEQQYQHQHRRESFSMSDIDDCMEDGRQTQSGRSWGEGVHADGDESVYQLRLLKSLEGAVQGFQRRLRDWASNSQTH